MPPQHHVVHKRRHRRAHHLQNKHATTHKREIQQYDTNPHHTPPPFPFLLLSREKRQPFHPLISGGLWPHDNSITALCFSHKKSAQPPVALPLVEGFGYLHVSFITGYLRTFAALGELLEEALLPELRVLPHVKRLDVQLKNINIISPYQYRIFAKKKKTKKMINSKPRWKLSKKYKYLLLLFWKKKKMTIGRVYVHWRVLIGRYRFCAQCRSSHTSKFYMSECPYCTHARKHITVSKSKSKKTKTKIK